MILPRACKVLLYYTKRLLITLITEIKLLCRLLLLLIYLQGSYSMLKQASPHVYLDQRSYLWHIRFQAFSPDPSFPTEHKLYGCSCPGQGSIKHLMISGNFLQSSPALARIFWRLLCVPFLQ